VNPPEAPGRPGSSAPDILVCFAVGAEAAPFRRRQPPGSRILVTGMGAENARRGLHASVEAGRPAFVLTCGFAGGLAPDWPPGTVAFDLDPDPSPGPESGTGSSPSSEAGRRSGWERRLRAAGAVPGRFHCATRVAVTVDEKRRLRAETGADLVEMESGVIRACCRERGIPSATVRVISDAAGDDLPLDFNALMNAECRLDPLRMAGAILRSPGTVRGLLRLQSRCADAARRLAETLVRALSDEGLPAGS